MAARLSVAELVDLGDLDELLRRIDDLCDAQDWLGVVDLRDRCRIALERGRQLWPAASHAEYRLALQAPGRWAAAVVVPGAGQFALGPLSEVAASTHAWDELAPHLEATPVMALVAQERVLRGEDLTGDRRVDLSVSELPLCLQAWEPDYPLATYKPYTVELDDPPVVPAWEEVARDAAPAVNDEEVTQALVDLAHAWTTQSNGAATAVAVTGDAAGAAAALGAARVAEIDPGDALATMAWAGASGGAHGRRRGMAQGRFAAWWAVAATGDGLDDWPDVEPALDRVRWYRWEPAEPTVGWSLRLAAERPSDGRAWAVDATDRR